ncbi:MAG: S-layer homology domain-containing protein [Actinomycetota bacterium]
MPSSDRRRRVTAFVVAMAVLVATPLAVVATDAFDDVPESNVHHDDIAWLKDAGVTVGCNPPDNNEFCPGDPVLRQQMATFMRNLAENQVVNAATAEVAGSAYQAVRDESVSLDDAPNSASAESIVTLSDLPAGTYVVTATWGASRSGTDAARVVCHLTGGTEDVRTIQSVGGDSGFSLQTTMASTMATELSEGDPVNLSCHAESVTGGAPNIIDARVVAYVTAGLESTTVTE